MAKPVVDVVPVVVAKPPADDVAVSVSLGLTKCGRPRLHLNAHHQPELYAALVKDQDEQVGPEVVLAVADRPPADALKSDGGQALAQGSRLVARVATHQAVDRTHDAPSPPLTAARMPFTLRRDA